MNHGGVGEETVRHFELNVEKRISDNPWSMKLQCNSPFSSYSKRKSNLLTGVRGLPIHTQTLRETEDEVVHGSHQQNGHISFLHQQLSNLYIHLSALIYMCVVSIGLETCVCVFLYF